MHPCPVFELRWRLASQARMLEFLGFQQTAFLRGASLTGSGKMTQSISKADTFSGDATLLRVALPRVYTWVSSFWWFLGPSVTWSVFMTWFPFSRKNLEIIPKHGCASLEITKLPQCHVAETRQHVAYFLKHIKHTKLYSSSVTPTSSFQLWFGVYFHWHWSKETCFPPCFGIYFIGSFIPWTFI